MADVTYRGLTLTEQQSTRHEHDRWTRAVDGVRILVIRDRASGTHRVLCKVEPSFALGLWLRVGDARGADLNPVLDSAFARFSTVAEAAKARPTRRGAPEQAVRDAEIDVVLARVTSIVAASGGASPGRRR